ncbi:MAG TPA: peptidoglycan DD-metalloendopeptidase family protein [Candidatus Acidoferrales bacterium]|nr:peptidoglycan DD-metalloendopeptidase family protein [Candidatus Acidoferrales bacterium]
MRFLRRHACLLLVFLLAANGAAAEVERELEGIKKRIEAEKRGISRVKKSEGSVLSALANIEAELEKKSRLLKSVSARLESQEASLRKTTAELNSLNASLRLRDDLFRRRARALYKWQRGGSPAVLLGGERSLTALLRGRRYLELTLANDRQLLERYREEAERYARLRAEAARKSAELSQERAALVRLNESIQSEREKKRELLASLRREKELHARALKELEQSAVRLQKMLDEMSRKAVQRAPSGPGFEGKKGALDYPVRGEIVEMFGKTKHPDFAAEMFRKGVDIEAPLGEEVRAVEDGTVIFADRFSGYGRMMIIDHGQRYYTVYAHLDEMTKHAGQSVKRGETIGRVGESDSLKGPRLYFEIRKDGRPVDPMTWLRKR